MSPATAGFYPPPSQCVCYGASTCGLASLGQLRNWAPVEVFDTVARFFSIFALIIELIHEIYYQPLTASTFIFLLFRTFARLQLVVARNEKRKNKKKKSLEAPSRRQVDGKYMHVPGAKGLVCATGPRPKRPRWHARQSLGFGYVMVFHVLVVPQTLGAVPKGTKSIQAF